MQELPKKRDRVLKLLNHKQIVDEWSFIDASWMALRLADGKSIIVI